MFVCLSILIFKLNNKRLYNTILLFQRLVVNYSDSCLSTNTTIEALEQLNNNNLRWGMVSRTPTIALIRRGNCNWSEKLQVAHNISSSNNMSLSAILIYNNETTDAGSYQLYNRNDLRQSFAYKNPLPQNRNISFMNDNDLMSTTTTIPMPVYFAPASYANQFIQFISNSSNDNTDTKVLWQLTPLLMPLSSTTGTGNTGDESGDGSPFSRGYLSYVIALAAIFLVGNVLYTYIYLLYYMLIINKKQKSKKKMYVCENVCIYLFIYSLYSIICWCYLFKVVACTTNA